MMDPFDQHEESERLKDLESYSILDSLPEDEYDNITSIASQICGNQVSLITFVDKQRQWFKSHYGTEVKETPRELAFCTYTFPNPRDIFIVEDLRKDNRFNENPLVTGEPFVVFYAGVSLVSEKGRPLGTLCVIDHKPKKLNKNQVQSLKALSNQVMMLLKYRKNNLLLEQVLKNLEEKNQELEHFASIAAHDLKSPLANISGLTRLFLETYGPNIDQMGKDMLVNIANSSNMLKRLVNGLLVNSRSENLRKDEKSWIDLEALKTEICGLFSYENKLEVVLKSSLKQVYGNKTAIDQIFINLLANAIKYNNKSTVRIEIGVSEPNGYYEFYVQDNGPGIAPENREKIFRLFEIGAKKDKYGKTGHGIGLATVKKIVEKMGGSINVESTLGKGSRFIFTLEK